MINVISLGAGVQSSTMALMAAHGEITPMPDAAIFADTQWEPPAVYTWLDWLEKQLPFPVYRVTAGNLRDDLLAASIPNGGRYTVAPWFTKSPDGTPGMNMRQCTADYKVSPLKKKVVELTGGRKAGSARMWIGISTCEATRMKPSKVQYIVNCWPLIDLRMNRQDCLNWMAAKGYPTPPRSACIACPFHSDTEWRKIKADPVLWQDAIEVDAAIRNQPKMRAQQFAHRSLVPLAEVDLSTAEDRGQLNLFENECEGMCGV